MLEIVLEESEFLRFLLRKIVCELSVELEVVKLCGKSLELGLELEIAIDEFLRKKFIVECRFGGCKSFWNQHRVEFEFLNY